jgi:hypothetical protein
MDAMDYHSVEPELILEDALATNWINKLSKTKQSRAKNLYQSKTWRRGEYLMALLLNGF